MRSAKQTSQGAAPNVQNALPSSRVNKGLNKDELAFLPAALEIVETPPSPVGRTIVFSIIALS
jgi:hemolysin D